MTNPLRDAEIARLHYRIEELEGELKEEKNRVANLRGDNGRLKKAMVWYPAKLREVERERDALRVKSAQLSKMVGQMGDRFETAVRIIHAEGVCDGDGTPAEACSEDCSEELKFLRQMRETFCLIDLAPSEAHDG